MAYSSLSIIPCEPRDEDYAVLRFTTPYVAMDIVLNEREFLDAFFFTILDGELFKHYGLPTGVDKYDTERIRAHLLSSHLS